jgi:hypothetical protein
LLVGADPTLDLCQGGVSIRIDSAVRWHSWIAFGPHLTLDDSLGYPPRSEQQASRFEYNLAIGRHLSSHNSELSHGQMNGHAASCARILGSRTLWPKGLVEGVSGRRQCSE